MIYLHGTLMETIDKFHNYCKPRANIIVKTHALLTYKQGNKTIDKYITELHTNAGP